MSDSTDQYTADSVTSFIDYVAANSHAFASQLTLAVRGFIPEEQIPKLVGDALARYVDALTTNISSHWEDIPSE